MVFRSFHVARLAVGIAAGTIVTMVVSIAIFFPKWTVDDAYITYRYAQNLADYGELTWNVGQPPVEGYTGVLLPLLIAGLYKLGVIPTLGGHLIGFTCLLLVCIWLARWCRSCELNPIVTLVVTTLFISSPFVWTNAFSGLETTLFSWLILACLLSMLTLLRTERPTPNQFRVFLVLLYLCGLARPEGVALGIVCIPVVLAFLWQRHTSQTRTLLVPLLLFYIIPALTYFLWRWHYYDQFLPNTYYAKATGGSVSSESVDDVLRFFKQMLRLPVASVSLAAIAVAIGARNKIIEVLRSRQSRPELVIYVIGLIFVSICALQYSRSHLLMNFSHRFFVPFYPILLLTGAAIVDFALETLVSVERKRWLRAWFVSVSAIVLCTCQLVYHVQQFPVEIAFTSEYKQLLIDEHITAGKYLADIIPKQEWLIVIYDAGAIPYYSKLATVDFGRLNDTYLTREGITERDQIEYFFDRNAGAVIMTSYDSTANGLDPFKKSLTADTRFNRYRLVKVFCSPARTNYSQALFVRRDLFVAFDSKQ